MQYRDVFGKLIQIAVYLPDFTVNTSFTIWNERFQIETQNGIENSLIFDT
jgi:hypothetical protein